MTKLENPQVSSSTRGPAALVAMEHLRIGASALIRGLELESEIDRRRLSVLGLCVGRRVRMIRAGDPLIVAVFNGRVGIAADLARKVLVEPADPVQTGPGS